MASGEVREGKKAALTYAQAGVDEPREELALERLLHWLGRTRSFRAGPGAPALEVGHFANVLDLGGGLGLAISTDSVGTKILVAQRMRKFDTIGIDCVAMNVNDLICVGAEPIALVDCLAVAEADPDLVEEIGKGLYEGARQAGVSIPGGEIAQVREMLAGEPGATAFDLVGTAVGLVRLDEMVLGDGITPGDVILGLRSSGVHSNGLTLARRVLFDQARLDPHQPAGEVSRPLGLELLEPTRIYVREVLTILRSGARVRGLVNITGGGLLNLARPNSSVGYEIDRLPEPQPIFRLIQQQGHLPDAEMYATFNMGVGFCIITPEPDAETITHIAAEAGVECWRLGRVVVDAPGQVMLKHAAGALISRAGRFCPCG